MPKDLVVIEAFDDRGTLVEQLKMSCQTYYDESNPVIDEEAYRRTKQIRKITGTIFNRSGEKEQEFEVFYDENFEYLKGKAVLKDGTVVER